MPPRGALLSQSDPENPTVAAQPASLDPLIGTLVADKFRIQGMIGRGGMGAVYRAVQEPLGRPVALKVLRIVDGDPDHEETFRRRFFREASVCSRLTHPHTVRLFDFGSTDDDVLFIAMEYLEGMTLKELFRADAPIAPRRAIRLIVQVCGALEEAHAQGVVHRDLKPSNILVTEQGEQGEFIKVLDFGLAKEFDSGRTDLTRTGSVMGSPMYMSPEQIEGHKLDGRTDIYAIGVLLYMALTGTTPFKRGNSMMVLMSHVSKPPRPMREMAPEAEITDALIWTTLACLQKSPEDRFRSVPELVRALKACDAELRGDIDCRLELRLDDGIVLLPSDVEETQGIHEVSRVQRVSAGVPDSGPDATMDAGRASAGSLPSWARLMLVASPIVVGLAALAVAIVFAVDNLGTPVPEAPSVETIEPVLPPPEVVLPPAQMRVDVRSDPDGAVVKRGRLVLGTTPLQLMMPPGDVWTLDLSAEGRATRSVEIDGAIPLLQIILAPLPPEPVRRPSTEPKAREPDAKETTEEPPTDGRQAPTSDIKDPWAP